MGDKMKSSFSAFFKRFVAFGIAAVLLLVCGCSKENSVSDFASDTDAVSSALSSQKNDDAVILFTGDVHCGIDKGFGYAGLQQIKEKYENSGYDVLLVDIGDSVQGETIGTVTKGDAVIELMNDVGYDIAVPGNHEFDYGADAFLKLSEKADFPYLCCNLFKNGESVFDSYTVKDAAGIKIGFVGITTPDTITASTPSYFQNDQGETVYDFLQGKSHEKLYAAVQSAVDSARRDGAEIVYALGHMGMKSSSSVTYADIIENTNGIDVFLDGHSHDSDTVVMKNKDGKEVTRAAAGTKLNCIGYSFISGEEGLGDTGVWSWNNSESAPELLGIRNAVSEKVAEALGKLSDKLNQVIADISYTLTIYDPEAKDNSGNPVRMVRRAETNLGDFCADAILAQTQADIAIVNGGGIRTDFKKGEITYGDVINVFPFGNEVCVIEATGQQILDALEWGAQSVPDECAAFLQVAGMTYEINASIKSGCKRDENNMQLETEGERRVKNVIIGDEPLDPEKTYTVAGSDYVLLENGDGLTAFDGAAVINDKVKLDSQALIDYFTGETGGALSQNYAEPTGQGRIKIIE